ncbi:hypothetical protein GQ43DRAFT_435804 [Delitschia confertaspora ATCC 74209]|uniref:Zn(2)-C6 fungal-type domain-containing protein n=1 Tax=Delitschia confertaspora ATCC 74209 TaxID=1513339 RepID=A0A9P4JHA1_9PLEO|nr:hypothetical protein GQ43DRAFT_435804 [Delitschia confertaspora ATCC 74209]
MSQRRAIACTICAKAKTKCDKAVPTCSRCAAKGLPCEPRSTRRTSDSTYRQGKKRIVSPKRFSSANSMPHMRRDESPRSVPSFEWNSLPYPPTPMVMSSLAKMPYSRSDLAGLPMLTPLQTFSPHMTNEVYDYGSPEPNLSLFPPSSDKSPFYPSGRLTPQTPDSSTYSDPLSAMAEPFGNYLHSQSWPEEPRTAMGLGFETDIPGMMHNHVDVQPIWSTPDMDGRSTPIHQVRAFDSPLCESPLSCSGWTNSPLSVSPQPPPHTRAVPSLSLSECSVMELDTAPVAQDEWPCFRCNPSEMNVVKTSTSTTYLEGLKAIPKTPKTWEQLIIPHHSSSSETVINRYLNIQRLGDFSRDAVMDVVNSSVRKARQISEATGLSPSPMLNANVASSSEAVETPLVSPCTTALESLFRLYGAHFEVYYPSFAARKLDLTELLQTDVSKLFLVLIIAAGASSTPTMEAALLTNGLTESCRILLNDLTDNDLSLWKDPTVLRTALLSINLAAWSGEKWHIDVAKTQLDLYLTMLRRSGLLEYRGNYLPEFDGLVGTEISWKKWKQHEGLNRLVYSWIIVDQELALFHDKAPNFCTTELTAALPDGEALWRATSADNWASAYNAANPRKTQTNPSLHDLFKRLMSRELVNDAGELTRLQLRLLLHPIQGLVHHLHQCIGCFANDPNNAQAQNLLVQMQEVQAILGDWYTLCCKRMQKEAQPCPVLSTNLMMYHLICLNTMTYFPQIESFARGEISREQFVATAWARTTALGSAQRIWFHCGQLMRLVRHIPEINRPLWLPAVIYRVCLLLWSTGMTYPAKLIQPTTPFDERVFPIDKMLPESDALVRYLRFQQGTPMLSLKKGAFFSLTSPLETVVYCLEVMKEEQISTSLGLGIRHRLDVLSSRVKAVSPML